MKLHRFLRNDQGAAVIELAISYMLGLTMLLGILEFCMTVYTFAAVSEATRDGLHYATLHGSNSSSCAGPTSGCDSTAAAVTADITTFLAKFSTQATSPTITIAYPESSSAPPSFVTITTTYTYRPLLGLPGFTHTFHTTAHGRILY